MTVKKINQVHGVISHVCKFIKCKKIIPTFKCFSTIFLSQTEANFTNLVKSKDTKVTVFYHCQLSSFSNLSGKK